MGLLLAHVAVITPSYAPIAGYNLTFLAGNLLLLLLLLVLFAIILSWISLDFHYYSYYYHYFIYLSSTILHYATM